MYKPSNSLLSAVATLITLYKFSLSQRQCPHQMVKITRKLGKIMTARSEIRNIN